jgi:hypothetical protein
MPFSLPKRPLNRIVVADLTDSTCRERFKNLGFTIKVAKLTDKSTGYSTRRVTVNDAKKHYKKLKQVSKQVLGIF